MTQTPTTRVASPAPREHFLTVPGARLRYRDDGAGAALLLVHGWTLDLEMWEPQVQGLSGAWRVVRMDRRGHGGSSGVADVGRDGADLAALAGHLALNPLALLGMSQGARAVMQFALRSAQVRALILDGAPDLTLPEPAEEVPLERFRELTRRGELATLRREWAVHPLMQLRTRSAETHELLRGMIDRYRGPDLLAAVDGTDGDRAPLQLHALRQPTLIICGAQDVPARVQAARRLARLLPAAELALIEDAGHLPNLDNPRRYNELCRSFLLRHQ
jgi:pimeloyl-ACP methyl ester carboxylesterase